MTTPNIDHIVVLMLENRSFDHMLGYLNHPYPEIYPHLTNLIDNDDGQGGRIPVDANASTTLPVGPGHEHTDVLLQISPRDTRNNDGFIINFEAIAASKGYPGLGPRIMSCQKPSNLPILSELAREFAVCTRWHCSVPGMTWPNRNFAHAATSDGEVDIVKRFYYNKTIFEQLSEGDKDWRIFSDDGAIAQAKAFRNLWGHGWRNRFQNMDTFLELASSGNLPHYSFIEPDHFVRYSSSQHPMNNKKTDDDFRAGERLIRDIYMSLKENEETWHKTLLLITYDEHGGFFDRETPPKSPKFEVKPAHQDGDYKFSFDLLGICK